MKYFHLLLIAFNLVFTNAFPQISPIKFGDVSRADLETKLYPQESGAEAVVLCDYATAKMIYNNGFRIEFTHHVRIKIFKAAGYNQANIQIPFTTADNLSELKACTHNIENDQPVITAVGKKQFYLEKVNAFRTMMRFSFPNVREGSVIEYTYKIIQDEIRGFRSMRFQRTIPVRYVEYWATFPKFFNYTVNLNHNNIIRQQYATVNAYYNTTNTEFNKYQWSGTHLPSFQPEPMMPESNEYLAGVDFALTDVNFPGGDYYEVTPSYAKLTEKLLDNYTVGGQIEKSMPFIKIIKKITHPDDTPLEKMQVIYQYVQQHMQWNGYDEVLPDVSLTKAHRDGTGTNAEINLLLVNMLRGAGIMADPVILSTRDNGRINTFVAIAGKLNYVICLANIEGNEYLLDATDKFRPAGLLPFKCLNVEGWVLNKTNGRWIKLLNIEKYHTQESYELTLNEKGELTGHAEIIFAGYDAVNLRRLIHNEGVESFRQDEVAEAEGLAISNLSFQHLDSLQSPLILSFDVTFRHMLQSIQTYACFKPLISIFGDYLNPWVKDERAFPIDRGCPTTENLRCVINLPTNYRVEELPKASRIVMPNNDARFTFGASFSNNQLVIESDLTVSKTRFETNEYSTFREFYTQVNKKCNEMIILKAIN